MLKKKPNLFFDIRHLIAFIILFNKQFCHRVNNCLVKKNTCSYFANVAGIEYISKTN